MSKHYDNWEKLVGAVLKRDLLRRLALSPSISSSDDGVSSCSSSRFDRQLSDYKGKKQVRTISLIIDDASIWESPLPARSLVRFQISGSATLETWKKAIFIPVGARNFVIWTKDSPGKHLVYSPRYEPKEVQISPSLLIDIGGKISTRMLTSNTMYGAYLVYRLAFLSLRMDNTFADVEWAEVEIGSFYVDGGDEGEVEARVLETSNCRKDTITIAGIEFRPLKSS